MIIQTEVAEFVSGTQNLLNDELIAADAASDSLNWVNKDGHIELAYGRQAIGGVGGVGKNYGEFVGFQANGTPVRFRKVQGVIETLVGETWTAVISGLTVDADYVSSNYQSLAGAFIYFFGIDGIYKVCTANPTDYTSLYDASKNFKGFAFIDQGRTIMWGLAKDPTGLYGSYIDAQDGTVYTTVTGEATTTLTGTLAFRAANLTATCFGVQITLTGTGEVYTDDYNGNLTGNMGGTGKINYTTGVYTLSNSGAGLANYQWENSNNLGVTDFTKDADRVAGQGFVIRQDAGGDAIVAVLALAGSYFSLKKTSAYKFTLDTTDLAPTNEIFRGDIGISSLRSAVSSSMGILYINTSNPTKPRLEVLVQGVNQAGDTFNVKQLFAQFAFENYTYDDAMLNTWDKFLVIGCKKTNDENDTLLLCDVTLNTVNETSYGIRTSVQVDGFLYGGDPVSQTTYELFTGFDDMGSALTNYWEGNGECLGNFKARSLALRFIKNTLKRLKKQRYKGKITSGQKVGVYISTDDADFQLVGTILGNGTYVDYGSSYAIGTTFVGQSNVGGGSGPTAYNFFMEIKLKTGKFRKRKVRLVALGIGYVSIENITDWDYWLYQDKMPTRYRSKQQVSLDGTPNQDTP